MRNRLVLAFILIGVLIACAGLQGANSSFDVPTYTPLPPEALAGTETAYAPTWAAQNITQTAYIASFPTLNAEQGQNIRQTQDVLIEQFSVRATHNASWQQTSRAITTADAESTAQGTIPYILTETSWAATRAMETPDLSFEYTATHIIETATALRGSPFPTYPRPTSCVPDFAWTQIEFRYRNGLANPEIWDFTYPHCSSRRDMLFSHRIVIDEYDGFSSEQSYAIIEDAISKLPNYPPHQPEVSEIIYVWVYGKGYLDCGIVTYSNAIAAYEDGLRGEDLAQALGIRC